MVVCFDSLTAERFQKCDALLPICSPCLNTPGGLEDCEYTGGGPSRIQNLEDSISRLERRIRDLEASSPHTAERVMLHYPYGQACPGSAPASQSSHADSAPGSLSRRSSDSGEIYVPANPAGSDTSASNEDINRSSLPETAGPQVSSCSER